MVLFVNQMNDFQVSFQLQKKLSFKLTLFDFCLWNWLTPQMLSQLELKYLSMAGHFCVILGVQFLDMFLCTFFTCQKKKFLLSEHPFSLLPPMKKSEREKGCAWLPHSGGVLRRRTKKGQTRVLLGA